MHDYCIKKAESAYDEHKNGDHRNTKVFVVMPGNTGYGRFMRSATDNHKQKGVRLLINFGESFIGNCKAASEYCNALYNLGITDVDYTTN